MLLKAIKKKSLKKYSPIHVRTATVYLLDKQGHSGFMYLSIVRSGGRSGGGMSSVSSNPNCDIGPPSRSAYVLR